MISTTVSHPMSAPMNAERPTDRERHDEHLCNAGAEAHELSGLVVQLAQLSPALAADQRGGDETQPERDFGDE